MGSFCLCVFACVMCASGSIMFHSYVGSEQDIA